MVRHRFLGAVFGGRVSKHPGQKSKTHSPTEHAAKPLSAGRIKKTISNRFGTKLSKLNLDRKLLDIEHLGPFEYRVNVGLTPPIIFKINGHAVTAHGNVTHPKFGEMMRELKSIVEGF
ncbi:MAG: hypothetical protein HOE11_03685 [Candidatus Diapherotrites archaeon]|nr:hypothetical protein [Candidatus Diapherotrites archaeon]MBT4597258.1 hypothetical protein [Candidatus Diapherotrites archaeon]